MDVMVARKKTSQYRGVTKKGKKWAAQVYCGGGKVLYAGIYTTEIEAAKAVEKFSLENETVRTQRQRSHGNNKINDGNVKIALEALTGISDGWMCRGCGLISKIKPCDCPKCTGGGWDPVCMSERVEDISCTDIFKVS